MRSTETFPWGFKNLQNGIEHLGEPREDVRLWKGGRAPPGGEALGGRIKRAASRPE
jgi:hypothetical protein